jgi:hypothetical protein
MANVIAYLEETGEINTMSDTEVLDFMVNDYMGTCHSLSYEDMDWLESKDSLGDWDGFLFECNHCGWWCDTGEQEDYLGESICTDCHESVEENE